MAHDGWTQVWHKFAQTTTFHGLNKISLTSPFKTRRYVWLLIVASFVTLFTYQSCERLLHYLQRPVNVINQLIDNDTLLFPAVVICNENNFRLSAATRLGWYPMLNDVFSSTDPSSLDRDRYNDSSSSELSLLQILQETAHRKEDMITECVWDEEECGADNFTTTLTDYGVCYTFNDQHTRLSVQRTGAARGLRLRLNVEQYEYMRGLHSAAGLKILLHAHGEVPSVVNLGQAVPVGMHAFVGVDLKQVHNLGPPHGACEEAADYSHSTCSLHCKSRVVFSLCGCVDFYMPTTTDDSEGERPFCSLDQYIDCILPKQEEISRRTSSQCNCSASCHHSLYSSTVTYASTPMSELEHVAAQTSSLGHSFVHALEVAQRVFDNIVDEDTAAIEHVHSKYEELMESVEFVVEAGGRLRREVERLTADIKPRLWMHYTWGMERVLYTIDNDYVRLWDVVDERTIQHVTTGFYQFTSLFRQTLDLSLTTTDANQRVIWHEMIERDIFVRKSLALRALTNLTDIQAAFENGTWSWTSLATYNRHYDEEYMPSELFYPDSYREGLYGNWSSYLDIFVSKLDVLHNISQEVLHNQTYDQDELDEAIETIESRSRNHNYYRYLYQSRIVMPFGQRVSKKVEDFLTMNQTLFTYAGDVVRAFRDIEHVVDKLKSQSGAEVEKVLAQAKRYLEDKSRRKIDLARLLTSEAMYATQAALSTWLKDLRSRSVHMMDDWKRFSVFYHDTYVSVLRETYTRDVYAAIARDLDFYKTHRDDNSNKTSDLVDVWSDMLRTSSDVVRNMSVERLTYLLNGDFASTDWTSVSAELRSRLEAVSEENRLTDKLVDEVDTFVKSLQVLQTRCGAYLQGAVLDSTFHRNNFLQLNIYLKQLSYEALVQQPAYDVIALLSDIGGVAGLCIGASAMTIFEIFDACVMHLAVKFFLPSKTKPSSYAPSEAKDAVEYHKNDSAADIGKTKFKQWT